MCFTATVVKEDEKSASSPALLMRSHSSEDFSMDESADSPQKSPRPYGIAESPSLSKSLRYQDSSEDEKWDDDFDSAPKDPVMQIRGTFLNFLMFGS